MKYRLGACTATLKELEGGLGSTDFYLISKLGAARSIPTTLRYMPHVYCGMELNSLPVETTVAQINCLLQHYGTTIALGTTLSAAIEHLQVEIGVTGCPLLYDYKKYSYLATNTWTKSLLEKISAYGIEVKLKYPKMKQPRGSQDKCIMEMIVEGSGMSNKELESFNRPRKRQQAIFLSDIATAKGNKIDRLLLSDWQETHEGRLGKNRSTITFGVEMPTKGDWAP